MGDYFANFFDTSDFPARWYCGNWSEFLGWLHIGSDIAIGAAYFGIPLSLIYFARKRQDIILPKIVYLFALFILLCGTTHLIEATIFWYPIYRVSGLAKFLTAVVSMVTLGVIVKHLPSVMDLPSLAATNRKLEIEIQQRQEVQHELADQKRELELIYQSAPVGMSLVDREFRFLRINEALAKMNGVPRDDHIGRRADEILPDLHNQIRPHYEQVFETGVAVTEVEIEGKRPACGDARTWLASYYPLESDVSDCKQVTAVSAIVQDITLRKQQEQWLLQSEQAALAANQSKSEFLANMSHEIRTPMAAILGYADVLLGHLKDPDNRNCVLVMKRNGQFLLELINDILDLSRIEAGKMDVESETCELAGLVSDIDSLMQVRANEKQIELGARFTTPVPATIETDTIRLRQVLINLVGNAIKFTEKGSVRLEVSLSSVADFARNLDETNDIDAKGNSGKSHFIVFAIHDTGIGMSQEQQNRLFKPFSQGDASVTRQYGGSGLGLAISRRLIDMLGGEIVIESESGKGSIFRVTLPIELPGGVELVTPTIEHQVNTGDDDRRQPRTLNCRVLVVDDRRDVRHISQHFLEKAGATVSTAEDGQQGFDAAIAAREMGKPFDLIAMDMQMPNVDGLQATAELRTVGIETPIIALTADAMKGDREKCLNGGCDDYLSKPIDYLALVNMVARYTHDMTLAEIQIRRRERIATLRASLSVDLSNPS